MALVWLLLGASALFTALVTALQAATQRMPVRLNSEVAMLGGLAWQAVFILASVALTIILFTVLYKFLPNTHVPITEALPGAVLAGVLWEGAKFGFAYALPYFHYDLLYGSIGAAVAVLSWIYFSSIILLFGAQFTALLHRDHLLEASYKTGKPATAELQIAKEGSVK
jgi:membrane protein